MSDENEIDEPPVDEPPIERSVTGRKKRSDAGRPRGSTPAGGSRRGGSTRFERRTKAVAETIRELIQLGRPNLDIGDLSFLEVVNRDADAWGRFFAQLAEWFVPLGAAIDAFFGSSLITLLNMAPSFRAARRDLAESRKRRRAERQAQEEAEEDEAMRESIEREHGFAREDPRYAGGVFAEQPPPAAEPDLSLGVDPRAQWLASAGE